MIENNQKILSDFLEHNKGTGFTTKELQKALRFTKLQVRSYLLVMDRWGEVNSIQGIIYHKRRPYKVTYYYVGSLKNLRPKPVQVLA